jgi:hypothetical protein
VSAMDSQYPSAVKKETAARPSGRRSRSP